jgi:hypothetical protein
MADEADENVIILVYWHKNICYYSIEAIGMPMQAKRAGYAVYMTTPGQQGI